MAVMAAASRSSAAVALLLLVAAVALLGPAAAPSSSSSSSSAAWSWGLPLGPPLLPAAEATVVNDDQYDALRMVFADLCLPMPRRFNRNDCGNTAGVVDYDATTEGSQFDVVRCDTDGNIDTLYLYSNAYTDAPIPIRGLAKLTKLTLLDLAWSNLGGPIPAGISKLTNLVKLRLQFNNLCGSVPSLAALTALTELRLTGNKLTGAAPSGPIAFLRLANNYFTGTLESYYNTNQQCPNTFVDNCLSLSATPQCSEAQRSAAACARPPTCAAGKRLPLTCIPYPYVDPHEECISPSATHQKCPGQTSARSTFCCRASLKGPCWKIFKKPCLFHKCACPCGYAIRKKTDGSVRFCVPVA